MQRVRTEVRAERAWYTNRIDLAVMFKGDDGQQMLAEPPVMKAFDDGNLAHPTFSLTADEAQLLMDELWRCGLRPSEGTGSAGSLAATERHLKDMQAVAMGLLRKEGVELP